MEEIIFAMYNWMMFFEAIKMQVLWEKDIHILWFW